MDNRDIVLLSSELDDTHFEYVLLTDFLRGMRHTAQYHDHSVYELHTISQGEVRVFLEGNAYMLKADTLFLIPPGKMHLISESPDADRIGLRFSFSRIPGKNGYIYRHLCAAFHAEKDHLFLTDAGLCCRYLADAVNCFRSGASDYLTVQLLQAALFTAADALLPLPQNHAVLSGTRRDNLDIAKMEEFLNGNYQRHIPLSEAAALFHLSEKQTERLCLRLFHAPFTVLLNEKRISIAKFLLTQTQFSMEQIAASAGFGSVSYFYRRFRAAVCMTPCEYRNTRKT